MGYPPSGHGRTITSPSGPRPRQALPRSSPRGTGGRHVPAGPLPGEEPPRVPTRAAGSQGDTRPHLVAAGSRPGRHVPLTARRGAGEAQGRASPRHVEGAVTDEVTAHGVKRFRPAGPGAARGPTRRGGAGPPGRPDNALRKVKPAACEDQSNRYTGGAGVLQRIQQQGWKSDGEGKRSGGNRSRTANALYNCTTGAHVTRCNGQPLQNLNGAGKPARAGGRCSVIMPSRAVRARARQARCAGRDLRPRRRRLVSESVPHTCRTAGPRRPD